MNGLGSYNLDCLGSHTSNYHHAPSAWEGRPYQPIASARSFRSRRALLFTQAMLEQGVSAGQVARWCGLKNPSVVREWRTAKRSIPEEHIPMMRSVGTRLLELEAAADIQESSKQAA